eukprot:508178-Prorocentrum_minimum.AAC.2
MAFREYFIGSKMQLLLLFGHSGTPCCRRRRTSWCPASSRRAAPRNGTRAPTCTPPAPPPPGRHGESPALPSDHTVRDDATDPAASASAQTERRQLGGRSPCEVALASRPPRVACRPVASRVCETLLTAGGLGGGSARQHSLRLEPQ